MPGVEEDPNCSDSNLNTNIMDHLVYLGLSTDCNDGTVEVAKYNINDIL